MCGRDRFSIRMTFKIKSSYAQCSSCVRPFWIAFSQRDSGFKCEFLCQHKMSVLTKNTQTPRDIKKQDYCSRDWTGRFNHLALAAHFKHIAMVWQTTSLCIHFDSHFKHTCTMTPHFIAAIIECTLLCVKCTPRERERERGTMSRDKVSENTIQWDKHTS